MKTVRLGAQLEKRLDEVARATGQTPSQIIRDAVQRQCVELSGRQLAGQIADVIGAVASAGGQSRKTGRGFTELARQKHGSRRRRST